MTRSSTPSLTSKTQYSLAIKHAIVDLIKQVETQLTLAADNSELGVHGARKALKALRSQARLLRPLLGDHYKPLYAEIGACGRVLSSSRDAQVMLNTWLDLREKYADYFTHHDRAIVNALEINLARQTKAAISQPTLNTLAERVRQLEPILTGWEIPKANPVASGIKTLYKRAQKHYRRCRHSTVDEDFHDWRKAMKHLMYSLSALRKQASPALKPYLKALKPQTEWLGLFNDLCVLQDWLQAHDLYDAAGEGVDLVLTTEKHLKQQSALAEAAPLLADSPSRFVQRMLPT